LGSKSDDHIKYQRDAKWQKSQITKSLSLNMDTVERTILHEPDDGAGTGKYHHEKRSIDVERAVVPGIHNLLGS